MDISKWSVGKIMQLPDWCFGARWWVGEYMGSTGGEVYYRGGEEVLPQRFVLWGILISARSVNCLEALRLTIRLAGSAVATVADAKMLERLLKGVSISDILYEFYVNQNGVTWVGCERQLVEPNGKKLSLVTNGDQSIAYEMTVGILISDLPTEVPDWLVKA